MPATRLDAKIVRPLLTFHHATSKHGRVAVLATRVRDAGLHMLTNGDHITKSQADWLSTGQHGVLIKDMAVLIMSAEEWAEFEGLESVGATVAGD